jgi:hypothetical protein
LYKTIVDIDKEDKEDCQSSEDTNCYTMERSSSESSKLIDFSMNGKKERMLDVMEITLVGFYLSLLDSIQY